jgi:hypothetical protein
MAEDKCKTAIDTIARYLVYVSPPLPGRAWPWMTNKMINDIETRVLEICRASNPSDAALVAALEYLDDLSDDEGREEKTVAGNCVKIEVHAHGLSDKAWDALFDRVADAAHKLDEEVTCGGQACTDCVAAE